MRQVSTGGLPFREIRRRGKYYVDKTLLIKDMLDAEDGGVFLYTRPRRFGKTTNITMLNAFFNMDYLGNDWFDGLDIEGCSEYARYKNAFPVIQIDLKDINPASERSLLDSLNGSIIDAFSPFDKKIAGWTLSMADKDWYERVSTRRATEDELMRSVSMLCRVIHQNTGLNTVILIDEYDRAITNAFDTDSQIKALDILGRFMSATLKSNPYLQMAYITGVMQVAKAGFLSGMNNLTVNTVFSSDSDERFGFTEAEVRAILEYYGHPEKFDEVAMWYDGYQFGRAEVYNPFSVMMYVQRKFVPDSYWKDSGRNLPMSWMIQRTDSLGLQTVVDLINGGKVISELHATMSYEEMRLSNGVDLLSLMVMTGYMNAEPLENGLFELSIPNREVGGIVDSLLSMNRRVSGELFSTFNNAVLDGNADLMVESLQSVLADGSYFTLRDEASYESIVLTMMHGILNGYRVASEKESGNGRVDLMLEPKRDGDIPIIMELKVADSGSDLDVQATEAIQQIHDRKYCLGMKGDVILIGLAIRGKVVRGKVEGSSSESSEETDDIAGVVHHRYRGVDAVP